MKVLKQEDTKKVCCPNGGFISYRYLLESDNMGFTLTKTIIPKGDSQHWHYKHHLEACYCISGKGILTDNATLRQHDILPGTVYAVDKNDSHFFQAVEDCILIC